jgi:hypothetical protein
MAEALEAKADFFDLRGEGTAKSMEVAPATVRKAKQGCRQAKSMDYKTPNTVQVEERGEGPGKECDGVSRESTAHEGLLAEGIEVGVNTLRRLPGLEERERMVGVELDTPSAAQVERAEFAQQRLAAEQQAWQEEHAVCSGRRWRCTSSCCR